MSSSDHDSRSSSPESTSAIDQALRDDLASPADDSKEGEHNDNDNDDDERAHSFRERRLTYSRHHVLSDSAAAAVAELMADGEDYSDDSDGDDDDGSGDDVDEKKPQADDPAESTTTTTTTKTDKRKLQEGTSMAEEGARPHKRAKTEHQHLPSRILHAGEIVQKNSTTTSSSRYDARTGLYSHPSHPHQRRHSNGSSHSTNTKDTNNEHHQHENKWRRRFSFCSTAPDHVLPFPRHVVGTYSCHGMEPVYESDYELHSSDSHDDSDDNDNDHDEDNDNGGRDKNGGNDKKTSVAKINQDRGGIAYPYADSATQALFAVYDGHGEGGELVSQYALGEVQRLLEVKVKSLPRRKRKGGVLGCISEEGSDKSSEGGEDAEQQQGGNDDDDTSKGEDMDRQLMEQEEGLISQAMQEVFVKVDRGLLDEEDIEPMYSGTTACVVLLRNNKLYISNCGDSRAVLAKKKSNTPKNANDENDNSSDDEETTKTNDVHNLTTISLSIDQNPDSPGEKERILHSGGFVSPPPEPGLSSRVWLDASHTQIGLAMARSIGDHAVKGVGVIAEPVVTMHDLSEEDDFLIIATDGVWEFISSEDAVEIVAKHLYNNSNANDDDECGEGERGGGASEACEALIKVASEKWHEHEGDYRDDITAIVIRLKDLFK